MDKDKLIKTAWLSIDLTKGIVIAMTLLILVLSFMKGTDDSFSMLAYRFLIIQLILIPIAYIGSYIFTYLNFDQILKEYNEAIDDDI